MALTRTTSEMVTGDLAHVDAATELVIASGAITPTQGFHRVDTESASASDNLDTINTDNVSVGDLLFIQATDSTRTVVIKDGTGNIIGPGDVTLDNAEDICMLIYASASLGWVVVTSSNNGA
jgi:hypothetical protein